MSIGIKCGDRMAIVADVDAAMGLIAAHYGCTQAKLSCGGAEKGRKGEVKLRVWSGTFSEDAARMIIPPAVANSIGMVTTEIPKKVPKK
jgi:hypothetical protein